MPHVAKDDAFVETQPLLERVKHWRGFLKSPMPEVEIEKLRTHERTGRPLGSERFVIKIEKALDRTLRIQKTGRKKKEKGK